MKSQEDDKSEVEFENKKFLGLNEVNTQSDVIDQESLKHLQGKDSWEKLGVFKELIEVLQIKGFKSPSIV